MQIIVSDRTEIEAGLIVRTSYAVISIRDPDKRKAKVRKQSGLKDVLFLAFHDAEPLADSKVHPEIVLMSEKHAKQIRQFIDQLPDTVGTIVVHCEQGMSRSPAVAAALCKNFSLDDQRFFLEYQPNQYVYNLLCEQLLDHKL